LKTLHLVDGNSYAYRAFYGMPRLSNRAGQPTQAVYGFAMFILKLVKEAGRDGVAVTFDPKGKTFRHQAFEEYKATRKPMPDELVSQIPFIHELVRALGLPTFIAPGFEADDVIATLTRRALDAGRDVVIFSGDKDILQLVGSRVRVRIPRKEELEMDAAAVTARWGVPPERITDLLGLMGDDSDNLPGVPGVGEKTAAALLRKFGSLDELYQRLPKVDSAKLREKLSAARETVYKTRDLAVLRTDVPLPERLEPVAQDDARLRTLFAEMEFTRLLGSLPPPVPAGQSAGQPAEQLSLAIETVSVSRGPLPTEASRADSGMQRALRAADRSWCARVTGTTGDFLALGAGGKRWLVPWTEAAARSLRDFLEDPEPRKVVGDTKELARLAIPAGVRLAGIRFDAVLAAQLAGERTGRSSLADLARDRLGIAFDTAAFAGAREQGGLVLDALATLTGQLEKSIAERDLDRVLREIEIPVAPVVAAMELSGIKIDKNVLAQVEEEIRERLAKLEVKITKSAGGPFNILSPKQVAEVLFKKLQLPSKRRTKTGFSTDEAVLEELALNHPIPGLILEFRKLSKLVGTYLSPLPGLCDPDGLLHTTFHQLGAATGRMSSSDPNLQNIPVRGEIGQRIRGAFVPRSEDVLLLSADYSQIELRILAHVAQDRAFLEAFAADQDVHAATAAEMFGREPAEVSPDERRAAKAVNFGIIYGMTAFGLSRELKCDNGTAQDYLDRYFRRHPAIREYWNATLVHAREKGWVGTLYGRRRWFPEIQSANRARREEAEREALNHPVQGTAADLIKLAMTAVVADVPEARLILSIHDELLFEVPKRKVGEAGGKIRRIMEGVAKLSVPLKVESAVGASWAECHA
jgi:DNA polymerase-1